MKKTRVRRALFAVMALAVTGYWTVLDPGGRRPAFAADAPAGGDAAAWNKVVTDKDFDQIVATFAPDIKKSMRSSGTFLRGYRKLQRIGKLVALTGNIGAMKYDGEQAKKAVALREAGTALAGAAKKKSFAAAKKAAAIIADYPNVSPADNGDPAKWDDVIDLDTLMKGVSSIDSATRNAAKRTGSKFEDRAAEMAARSVLLACLAVVAREHEKKDDWQGWCDEMCADSLAMAKKFADGDAAGSKKAYGALQKSCTDCHEVYRPDE